MLSAAGPEGTNSYVPRRGEGRNGWNPWNNFFLFYSSRRPRHIAVKSAFTIEWLTSHSACRSINGTLFLLLAKLVNAIFQSFHETLLALLLNYTKVFEEKIRLRLILRNSLILNVDFLFLSLSQSTQSEIQIKKLWNFLWFGIVILQKL